MTTPTPLDLNTSAGARQYVADYFANTIGRHDFKRYITERLAADFACALSQHLEARAAQPELPEPTWRIKVHGVFQELHSPTANAFGLPDGIHDCYTAAQLQQGSGPDAYAGAREDLSIWKRRALEAERDLRAARGSVSMLSDSELEDLAHGANQEALSFGVSLDPFLKLANTVKARCMAALVEQDRPVAQAGPVLYVSPEQLAAFQDKGPKYGSYLPMRKAPAGKFTQPLYTSPPCSIAGAGSKGDSAS